MRQLFIFILLQLSFIHLTAQVDRDPPPNTEAPVLKVNKNRLYGKILDIKSNKGIEAASVQVYAIMRDTTSGETKESLVAAMLTKHNGDFVFEDLSKADSFRVMITISGYKPWIKKLGVENDGQDDDQETQYSEIDLGNILMEQDVKELGMVTVTTQKPALEMGIDRKIFNVEKSLVATGGTGIDVIKNIPSVSVDVEGNILLRNNTPQIFVDGRPTILTLDQIPADNIERVELITNPSAKFDAASGAGIINVILKRNKRVGLNGILSAGAGIPDLLNGNITVNMREGKFNFFASSSYNRSGGRTRSRTLRQNKNGGVIENYFNQYSRSDRLRSFGSVRLGFDYFLDNRNTISLTQNIVRGKTTNNEEQDQENLNINYQLEYFGERFSDNLSRFNRNNSQLNFTHKFPEQGKELTANVNYNFGNGTENTGIINHYFNPDGSLYTNPAIVRNNGRNDNDQWTMQVDFTDPNGENEKLETGIRSFINKYRSVFNSFAVDNGTEIKLPLSNNYKYVELINAFYITYTNTWKTIGYQLGLRTEYSRFDGELIDSAKKFGYEYPDKLNRVWDALFPSIFISKQVNENVELQVNYSRRIRRPNFWQLNPFIDINDPVNLRQGNPGLRPEFINSFEFNYSHGYGEGNNFLGVIYYRNNPGDITRYSDTISAAQYQQLNNAAVDPNAILNTFINAQSTNRLGAEFTLQQTLGKNFDITPTIDLQYREVKARFNELDLNNKGFSYEAELSLNFRTGSEKASIFRDLGLQLIGEYESAEVVPQGRSTPEYQVDFALRKDFLKEKKANITFSISDVFNSQRFGTIYDTENFYQDSYTRRNVRSFRLVFTYKFGNADFSLRRNRENGDNEDEQ